jgi:hypothetical protein
LKEKEYLAKGHARQIVEECQFFEGDFLEYSEEIMRKSNFKDSSQRDRKRLASSLRGPFQDAIFGFECRKNYRKLRFMVAHQEQGEFPRLVLRNHYFDQVTPGRWTHFERPHLVITNHALQRLYLRGGARSLREVKAYIKKISGWVSTINLFSHQASAPIPTPDGLFVVKAGGKESILVTFISKEKLYGRTLEIWEDLHGEEDFNSISPDLFSQSIEGKKQSEIVRALQLRTVGFLGDMIKELDRIVLEEGLMPYDELARS